MNELDTLLKKYQDGLSTANECAVEIVFRVPVIEFRDSLDKIPKRVLDELAWLSDEKRRERIVSNYGPAPTGEQLAPFGDVIRKASLGSDLGFGIQGGKS